MIQNALTNMMAKVAQQREKQIELDRIQGKQSSDDSESLVFEESEIQKNARGKIISCVEELFSYFPHPSQPIYFIRTLEKMKLEPQSKWFIWGAPPLPHLKAQLSNLNDPEEIQYFNDIIDSLEKTCIQ